jgi:hypothetical protein
MLEPDDQLKATLQALSDRLDRFLAQSTRRRPSTRNAFFRALTRKLAISVPAAYERARHRWLTSWDASRRKPKPGRPKKPRPLQPTILTGLRLKKPGRPRKFDSQAILALVDERRNAGVREGRRLLRGSALCELLAEAIEQREPRKWRTLQRWRRYYEQEEELSPRRALRRALNRVAGKQLQNLERLLSYAVTGRRK